MTLNEAAAFIEVEAGVRYWEDAIVNGVQDDDGALIPGRDKDAWRAIIDLRRGRIVGWPAGTTASIHYKVCDAGRYWLLDEDSNKIAKQDGYVPDSLLCHGDKGFGDYIIMKVDADGSIAEYHRPDIDPGDWQPLAA